MWPAASGYMLFIRPHNPQSHERLKRLRKSSLAPSSFGKAIANKQPCNPSPQEM